MRGHAGLHSNPSLKKPGLYVHIPFCRARCNYCDFVSTAGLGRQWQERYLGCIINEWKLYRDAWTEAPVWDTVYFGGGTPTYLDEDILAGIIGSLPPKGAAREQTPQPSEITVEANPGTLTESKLRVLKQNGCNRLSVGAQSFDDTSLSRLGRIHTADDFRQAWEMARSEGFINMNLDLIYGLPDRTQSHWERELKQALICGPEHISLYQLNIEEGTPFAALAAAGRINAADEEECRGQYLLAHQILTEAGYLHYEISNYAKPGMESRHNINYWKNGLYLGLGAGAAGYLPGFRYTNKSTLDEYMADLDKDLLPIAGKEDIDGRLALTEELMLAFRLSEGVKKDGFDGRWGFSFMERYAETIGKYVASGLLEENDERIYPTIEGWLNYNSWITDFM